MVFFFLKNIVRWAAVVECTNVVGVRRLRRRYFHINQAITATVYVIDILILDI